jgi:hypothetical protein
MRMPMLLPRVQLGFIGMGRAITTATYFGDASPNAAQGKLTNTNWQDRIAVYQSYA